MSEDIKRIESILGKVDVKAYEFKDQIVIQEPAFGSNGYPCYLHSIDIDGGILFGSLDHFEQFDTEQAVSKELGLQGDIGVYEIDKDYALDLLRGIG